MSAAVDHGVLPAGLRSGVSTVRVPASTANLGPGFDSLGLALAIHDLVSVEALPPGAAVDVAVRGEGAGAVPLTEEHLVVRAVRAALGWAGAAQPALRLRCRNAIPHGKGLGSSASAVVAGAVAARGLLADPQALDDDAIMAIADGFEGHPDNVAASLFGGCTVSWVDSGPDRQARAVRLDVHPDVVAVVCVPDDELPTSTARAMLPPAIPHADAAFNAGRAALLVEAITRRPDLLLPATEDRLHQEQRAPAMPAAATLLAELRRAGLAAVISGAGPSILVLADSAPDEVVARVSRVAGDAWDISAPGIDMVGTAFITDSGHVL